MIYEPGLGSNENVTVKNRLFRLTALLKVYGVSPSVFRCTSTPKRHDLMIKVQGMIASFISWMIKMFATGLFKTVWYIEKHFMQKSENGL